MMVAFIAQSASLPAPRPFAAAGSAPPLSSAARAAPAHATSANPTATARDLITRASL